MEELNSKDILKSIIELRESMRESQKETDRQLKETDRILTEKFQKTDRILTEKISDLRQSQKETDRILTEKFQKTDRILTEKISDLRQSQKETDKMLKKFIGGYGDTSEEYFYQGTKKKMKLGNIKFDFINRNVRKHSGAPEFDIVLYNGDSIGIIEVKTRANPHYLNVEKKINDFKESFPQYKDYKFYFGVATMSTKNDELFEFCSNKGIFLLGQNGDHLELLNEKVRTF